MESAISGTIGSCQSVAQREALSKMFASSRLPTLCEMKESGGPEQLQKAGEPRG
jgi:hypothetical protein